MTLKEAADDVAALIADDPAAQWNAYCEVVYGFAFICVGDLGAALAKRGIAPEMTVQVGFGIHRAIVSILLALRSGVRLGSDEASKMYVDHQKILEQTANLWAGMPLFKPAGADTPAGSLTWEVPKQAARSALGDESAAGPKLMEASVDRDL